MSTLLTILWLRFSVDRRSPTAASTLPASINLHSPLAARSSLLQPRSGYIFSFNLNHPRSNSQGFFSLPSWLGGLRGLLRFCSQEKTAEDPFTIAVVPDPKSLWAVKSFHLLPNWKSRVLLPSSRVHRALKAQCAVTVHRLLPTKQFRHLLSHSSQNSGHTQAICAYV